MTTEQLNHFWRVVARLPRTTPVLHYTVNGPQLTRVRFKVHRNDSVSLADYTYTWAKRDWNRHMRTVDGVFNLEPIEARLRIVRDFRTWFADKTRPSITYEIAGAPVLITKLGDGDLRINYTDATEEHFFADDETVSTWAFEQRLLSKADYLYT